MTKEPITPLLSVSDVAKLFGVGTHTIRRWMADGKLPGYKLCGSVRIRSEDVNAFILKNERR